MCLLHLACLFYLASTEAMNTYYFDELCGTTIDMTALNIPAGRLLLRRPENSIRHFNCIVYVTAPSNMKLIININSMYLASPFGCEHNYVLLTEGNRQFTSKLCGSISPEDAYVTDGRYVTVLLMKRVQFVGDQFDFIFTAAYKGPCESDQFSCANDLCISQQLQCNGFNNCGDGSDLCIISVGAIAGIVIACIIAVIIVAFVLAIFVYRHRKKKMDKFERILQTYSMDGSLPRDFKFNSLSSRADDFDLYSTILKDRSTYKMHTLDPSTLKNYGYKEGPLGPNVMDHVVSFRAYPAPVPEKDEFFFHGNSSQGTLLYSGHSFHKQNKKEETGRKRRLSEERDSFDLVKL